MSNKLTPEMIDNLISNVEYIQSEDSTLTICVMDLDNGCTIVGTSNVIDSANYDAELGRTAAFNNTKGKIWELEGYAMKRDQLDLIYKAAEAAHEANRVYCLSLGDDSQVPWVEAEAWQRMSAIEGVYAIKRNPDSTPADNHANWLAHKESEGWIWGETKDPEAKMHPCMVPYDELPEEQKLKDELFGSVVRAVLGL